MSHEAIVELPSLAQALSVLVRLFLAAVLGGILGWERERLGKTAGLRTHMLVSLGSALFVLAPLEAGATAGDLTRVVQGIATGIGFVGAGAILKLEGQGQVKGLTTASTVWIAAAVGMAVGVGLFWVSAVGTALGLCILVVLRRLEGLLAHPHAHDTT
ncbi:MAG: MgtC/SapB family protein [Candidatus Rokubacteria bacterium]|jgi:putative Mg2+ transporter-C (MgtC) family protein|nr:MgtC/SapB family protein [Candidatus Rokubacteria bacterium]